MLFDTIGIRAATKAIELALGLAITLLRSYCFPNSIFLTHDEIMRDR
jgi:hypothetical protein